jgi:hypothetical protein
MLHFTEDAASKSTGFTSAFFMPNQPAGLEVVAHTAINSVAIDGLKVDARMQPWNF